MIFPGLCRMCVYLRDVQLSILCFAKIVYMQYSIASQFNRTQLPSSSVQLVVCVCLCRLATSTRYRFFPTLSCVPATLTHICATPRKYCCEVFVRRRPFPIFHSHVVSLRRRRQYFDSINIYGAHVCYLTYHFRLPTISALSKPVSLSHDKFSDTLFMFSVVSECP